MRKAASTRSGDTAAGTARCTLRADGSRRGRDGCPPSNVPEVPQVIPAGEQILRVLRDDLAGNCGGANTRAASSGPAATTLRASTRGPAGIASASTASGDSTASAFLGAARGVSAGATGDASTTRAASPSDSTPPHRPARGSASAAERCATPAAPAAEHTRVGHGRHGGFFGVAGSAAH